MRLLIAIMFLLLAAGVPAWAQSPPAPPEHESPPSSHRHHGKNMPPVDWQSLDTGARQILAPLKPRWERMPPHVQHHIMRKAQRWEHLPSSRREAIRQRISRWEGMSPTDRRRARANHRVYRHLTRQQRTRLHDAYERFKGLPPEQQKQLREKWHELSPGQRRQWIKNGADGSLPRPAASTHPD